MQNDEHTHTRYTPTDLVRDLSLNFFTRGVARRLLPLKWAFYCSFVVVPLGFCVYILTSRFVGPSLAAAAALQFIAPVDFVENPPVARYRRRDCPAPYSSFFLLSTSPSFRKNFQFSLLYFRFKTNTTQQNPRISIHMLHLLHSFTFSLPLLCASLRFALTSFKTSLRLWP